MTYPENTVTSLSTIKELTRLEEVTIRCKFKDILEPIKKPLLLIGNEGSGKTFTLKEVLSVCESEGLKGHYINVLPTGPIELPDLDEIDVLLLDDIHNLLRWREEHFLPIIKKFMGKYIKQLKDTHKFVIATANKSEWMESEVNDVVHQFKKIWTIRSDVLRPLTREEVKKLITIFFKNAFTPRALGLICSESKGNIKRVLDLFEVASAFAGGGLVHSGEVKKAVKLWRTE